MKPITNIVGRVYGRLTVLSANGCIGKKPAWLCRCACGGKKVVIGCALKSGHISSCGCLRLERLTAAISLDVTGQRFARLVALHATDGRIGGCVAWSCLCDCGKQCLVAVKRLKSGNTTSCGCRKIEARQENVGAMKVDMTGRRYGMLVVIEHADVVKRTTRWLVAYDCGQRKVVAAGSLAGGKTISCGCASRGKRKGLPLMPAKTREYMSVRGANRRAALRGSVGQFSVVEVSALFDAQKGQCASCAVHLVPSIYHRDHIMPLSLGGGNDIGNIQILCRPCNLLKGALHPDEWAERNMRA